MATSFFPYEGFLEVLRENGFSVGVDSYMRVQSLIDRMGPKLDGDRLKYLLCPLFAHNEKEQKKFYRLYDNYFQLVEQHMDELAQGLIEEIVEPPPPQKRKPGFRIPWTQILRWGFALLSILLSLYLVYLLREAYLTMKGDQNREGAFEYLQKYELNKDENYVIHLLRYVRNDLLGQDQICDSLALVDFVPGNATRHSSGGYEVEFLNRSIDSISSRTWIFGDSSDSDANTAFSPTHVYQDTGTYAVSLQVENQHGCRVYVSKLVKVSEPQACWAGFSYFVDPTNDRLVHFTDSSLVQEGDEITQWVWHLGDDNNTVARGASASIQYQTYKPYKICLTIRTQEGYQDSLCKVIRLENPMKSQSMLPLESAPMYFVDITQLSSPNSLFLWLLAAVFLVIGGVLYEIYRQTRRQLIKRKPRASVGPFTWNLQSRELPPVYGSNLLHKVATHLRQRQESSQQLLNLDETIKETIEAGGYPHFRFQAGSRPSEYLVLIEQRSGRDHQARLFQNLMDQLGEQDVYVDQFFFRSHPQLVYKDGVDSPIYLHDLKTRYPDHRLIIFGDGEGLIDPVSGEFQSSLFDLLDWRDRAILTPVPPADWGFQEISLARQMLILPATTQSLFVLLDELEDEGAPAIKPWSLSDARPSFDLEEEMDVEHLKAYLDDDVFRWLAACSVHPELHWALTLSLGRALETQGGPLITEKHLLRLVRLPYFRSGGIPDSLRLALVDTLDAETLALVRRVILELLVQNPPPEGSIASERQQRQLVSQQWELAQGSWIDRRKVREQMEEWVERDEIEDIVVLRDLGRKRSMKMPGKGAPHWSKWMFRHGMPLLGMKSWLRLGAVFLIFGMIVTPLYQEKVTWNNLVEFRQWLRNPGNVVLINDQYYRLANEQDSARYFSYLGGELYQLGDYGSAYNQFRSATELQPFEQLYHYQLGLASFHLASQSLSSEDWKQTYEQFALANALAPLYTANSSLKLSRTFTQDQLTAASLSNNARWIALANGSEVQLFEWDSDTIFATWTSASPVQDISFSEDSRYMLQTEGPKASIFLCARAERLGDLDDHTLPINALSFSPDGRYVLTASDDQAAVIWNREARRPFHVLEDIHFGPLTDAAFSPGGSQIVTASEDSSAVIWDLLSGEFQAELLGQNEPLRMARFLPDNQTVLTASDDGRILLWDKEGNILDSAHIVAAELYQFCLSPDYSTLFTLQKSQIDGEPGLYIWNFFEDRLIQSFPLPQLGDMMNEGYSVSQQRLSSKVSLQFESEGKHLMLGVPNYGALIFDIEETRIDSLKFYSLYNQSLVAYHQQRFTEAFDGFGKLLQQPSAEQSPVNIWYARGLNGLYLTLQSEERSDTASFHQAIRDFAQALKQDTSVLAQIGSLIPFFHEVYNTAPEEYVAFRSELCELLKQYEKDACVIFDFDEIRAFKEGRAAIRLGDNWGFIDTLQQIVIPPQYRQVDDYVLGTCFATDFKNQLHILDLEGSPVFSAVGTPSEGLVAVRDMSSGLWGYLEMKSHLLVIASEYEEARPFALGYAKVRKNKKYGFIDIKGEEGAYGGLVYDNIKGEFGLDKILLASKDGKPFKIVYQAPEDRIAETTGESFRMEEMNSPFSMDEESIGGESFSIVGPESNGRIRAVQEGKYGFLRPAVQEMFQIPYAVQGEPEVVIEFQYENARDFSHDRAAVKLLGGKWGYIDPSGKEVIPFVFDRAEYFVKEGAQIKARVSRDGRQYEIDMGGNCLHSDRFPCQIEWLSERTPARTEYVDKETGLIGFMVDGKWGLRSAEGDTLVSPQYDNGIHFSGGLARISKNGKWGFLNPEGQMTIPLEYEEAQDFSEGLAAVKKGDKWGYIDQSNQEQITFDYDQAKPFRRGKAIVTQKGRSSKINDKGDKAANRIK